jgi:hypothetical protein
VLESGPSDACDPLSSPDPAALSRSTGPAFRLNARPDEILLTHIAASLSVFPVPRPTTSSSHIHTNADTP